MLRIGLLCHSSCGGSGVVASELALALCSRGYQVHVFAKAIPPRLSVRSTPSALHLHTCPAQTDPGFETGPGDPALVARILSVHTKVGLDLLHAHFALPHAVSAVLAAEAASELPKPLAVVTTLHGTDVVGVGSSPSFLPMVRFALNRSHAISCVSTDLADQAQKRLLQDQEASTPWVIPNFVDPNDFHPQGERLPGPPRFVHASNLRPIKRVPWLIEAFALATQPGSDAEACELWIVGDGPERRCCEQLAKQLGVGSRVRFMGEQKDVAAQLRGALGFVLTSSYEAFGLSALEAMASGVPVVACNVGGISELVSHSKDGFLVQPDDLVGFASRLRILCVDHELSGLMGRAARQRAICVFAKEAAVDQYEQLYQSALSRMSLGKVGGDRWKQSGPI